MTTKVVISKKIDASFQDDGLDETTLNIRSCATEASNELGIAHLILDVFGKIANQQQPSHCRKHASTEAFILTS